MRERPQAVLVLEVVFSAFYVSYDFEFEFIENISVEVALPQQFRKQRMTKKRSRLIVTQLHILYSKVFWAKKIFVLYMM